MKIKINKQRNLRENKISVLREIYQQVYYLIADLICSLNNLIYLISMRVILQTAYI